MSQVQENALSIADPVGSPAPDPAVTPASEQTGGEKAIAFIGRYGAVLLLVGLIIAATLTNDGFWNADNIRNILTQNSPVALVALGMTFVIISGVFDLSVGAIFAGGAVVYATLASQMALPAAALLTIVAVGLGAGLFNGVIVQKMNVNSFIGTIGTGAIFSGCVYIYCNSSPVQVDVAGFETLGLGRVAGIPWPVIITVALFVVGGFFLSRTVFGRHVFASGGNPEAARLAGIRVDRVRIITFLVVGALTAVAGMITASQLSVGQPTLGAAIAIDAFAIVVIGGTSVYGGQGAIWRTAVGVLILAVLTNLFNAMAWDSTRQSVAKGLVLVAAVALDAMRQSRR